MYSIQKNEYKTYRYIIHIYYRLNIYTKYMDIQYIYRDVFRIAKFTVGLL